MQLFVNYEIFYGGRSYTEITEFKINKYEEFVYLKCIYTIWNNHHTLKEKMEFENIRDYKTKIPEIGKINKVKEKMEILLEKLI